MQEISKAPTDFKLGLVVNDFADVNIDASLLAKDNANVLELSNGCVCCSLQNELPSVLQDLWASSVDYLVVETSGALVDPCAVIETLQSGTLKQRLVLHKVMAGRG